MSNSGHISGKTRVVALGGVFTALSVICLYFASFMPGIELTMYALCSAFVPLMIIEGKARGGVLLYIAVSLLGLLIVPNTPAVMPYIFFFGIYGILKYYCEKAKSPIVQMSAKIGFFLIIAIIAYTFFYNLFFSSIELPDLAPLLLLAGAVVFFIVYDFLLSSIINYYFRRFYGKV